MQKFIAMGALVGLAAATHPINEDIVSDIKSKTSNWTPMEVATNPLANKSAEEIRGMLGTIIAEPFGFQQPAVSNAEVPATFDARTEWPGCVHDIRDQAQCGSCWAFGASEALSDRFCIASKGSVNVVLSPEDLVECNSTNMGCNGGYLGMAWRYLQNTGIVSDACDPYVSGGGQVPQCPSKCADGETYTKYQCKSGSIVEATTPAQIMSEIQANGPMETAFTVYSDFMNYQSGVYHHVSGTVEGGHAVKILGWGTESGMDYWLCANSWGTSWGIDGFFKIKQGDCGIDSTVYACTPDVSTATITFQ